ncbi:MAG: PilN domain-containing protein [Geminicoccaceae bacterium]|nr:PilN domain-containing protein [Geminicoccaceae bacterium]HRY24662.1 PilN domain-containing protein [Geminicoccaceae bacterium]
MAVALSGQPGQRGGGFFAWWADELAGLMPANGRRLPTDRFVVAVFDGRTLQFALRHRGRVEQLGTVESMPEDRESDTGAALLADRINRRELPLVLRLVPDLGIQTADRLPVAAKGELRSIIANKLDMLTPWSAETACFDTVRVGTADGDMLAIEIAVAPEKTVARAVDAVERLGLVVDVVDLGEDDPYAPPTHDLLHGNRPRRLPRWLPIGGALLAAAAVTIGIFAYFDIEARNAGLAQRRAYASLLEQRLEDLPEIRGRIDALEAGSRAVLERHLGRPSTLATIEKLSRLLPDTVWLDTLTIDGRRLTVTGYSGDAARLPALIEGNASFEAARLTAPSERRAVVNEVGDLVEVDQFSLQAEVRPGMEVPR